MIAERHNENVMLTDIDIKHLRHRAWLTRNAVPTGNPPCGRLLLSAGGELLAEDRKQIQSGDRTHHSEHLIP